MSSLKHSLHSVAVELHNEHFVSIDTDGFICHLDLLCFCLLEVYYAPNHREWGSKHCFCPSIRRSACLFVAYIANNSRTQRPSVPIPYLEGRFSTSDATCVPVSRSNGQRSWLEAVGGTPC